VNVHRTTKLQIDNRWAGTSLSQGALHSFSERLSARSSFAHRITPHLNPVRVMDWPIKNPIRQRRISDLLVPGYSAYRYPWTMANETVSIPFGLVGGLGVGAGIFYYRSLVSAHAALGVSPQIILTHADVRRVLGLANARETRELADYLAGLLRQLAAGGARIATIPAFAPQVCARELAGITPLPLVNLLDAIAEEVDRRGLRRLAVFGARVTMQTSLFGRLHGLAEVVSMSSAEIDRVAGIYGNIVANEGASPEEFDILRTLAHTMVERERLDAILLAGTDLAFVFGPGNTDFPHLDGARTHIDAIMRNCQLPQGAIRTSAV
jgi:aspartate racemase